MTGNAGHRGRVLAHPSAPAVEPAPKKPTVDEFDAPNDLTTDERLVWLELAPLALEHGTLTPPMSLAFRILCQNVVILRDYARSVLDRGSANHRGMIQRVDAELSAFGLRPFGKAVVGGTQPQQAPVDPLKEKYFGGRRNRA